MNKFNERLAVQLTKGMSTMWCAYAFFIWSLLPLPFPQLRDIVYYVSGGIIQLVALSLIMVGQQVMGRAAEIRAQQDHETLMKEFKSQKQEIRELHKVLKNQDKTLENQEKMIRLLENKNESA